MFYFKNMILLSCRKCGRFMVDSWQIHEINGQTKKINKSKTSNSDTSLVYIYILYIYISRQFIATSAEVTPNGGLVRESPPKWP